MKSKKVGLDKFCESYVKNVILQNGDGSVFRYSFGNLVGCENYSCIHHNGQKLYHQGEEPLFGFCNTFGLKQDREKLRLISDIIQGVIEYKSE